MTNFWKITIVAIAIGTSPVLADSPGEIFGLIKKAESDSKRAQLSFLQKGPTLAHERMAQKAEVSVSDYSHSDIMKILAARGTASSSVINLTMDELHGKRPFAASHVSQGESQLAGAVKVDATDYALSALAKMKFAQDD